MGASGMSPQRKPLVVRTWTSRVSGQKMIDRAQEQARGRLPTEPLKVSRSAFSSEEPGNSKTQKSSQQKKLKLQRASRCS